MYAEIDTLIWYPRNSATVLRSSKRLLEKHIWTVQMRWMLSFVFIFHSLLIFIDLKMVLLRNWKDRSKKIALQNLIRFVDHKFSQSTAEAAERKKLKESGKKLQVLVDGEQFCHFPRGDLVISTAMDFRIEIALAFISRFWLLLQLNDKVFISIFGFLVATLSLFAFSLSPLIQRITAVYLL